MTDGRTLASSIVIDFPAPPASVPMTTDPTPFELPAEDVALIEGEHGPLDVSALCRTAVHEYAQMLRREKFMELAGAVEWVGPDDPERADRDPAAGLDGVKAAA